MEDTKKISRSDVTERFVLICNTLMRSGVVSTREQFSNSCGVMKQNYSAIAHGKRDVPIGAICMCIEKYNVSPNWLFLGVGDMFLS